MKPISVLIIEDDPAILGPAEINLRKEGYLVRGARTLKEGKDEVAGQMPDLLVLDINLPDGNGLTLCRKLTTLPPIKGGLPVLVVTARGSTEDIVAGLEAGAQDYMVKPFNMREFLARVRAMIRNSTPVLQHKDDWVSGGLRLSEASHQAWRNDTPVNLTLREFDILAALAEHQGKALSREEIVGQAWGPSVFIVPRVVDVHIGHIRAKLGKLGKRIETVPQLGFRLAPPPGKRQ
jgi:DNA-binding response OmpR family regulator